MILVCNTSWGVWQTDVGGQQILASISGEWFAAWDLQEDFDVGNVGRQETFPCLNVKNNRGGFVVWYGRRDGWHGSRQEQKQISMLKPARECGVDSLNVRL